MAHNSAAMKFHSFILPVVALLSAAFLTPAAAQTADFGGAKTPYEASAVFKNVNFETTQNLDIKLPPNFKYRVESVEAIVRTAPSAVTTAARLGLSSYDGSTATVIRGTVALNSATTGNSDILFAPGTVTGGYVYYQNIVAAGTTGLCTENVTLNTPGALAGVANPDVPRKIVLTLVDNAGANLAGTVTLTGQSVEGETFSEVITVSAGTVSYTTSRVFAKLTSGSHNFGATGVATDDTLNLGQSAVLGLPARNATIVKLVTDGTEEAASASDPDDGGFTPTTAPNAARDYEVWYRTAPMPVEVSGGQFLRLVITGSTVTGDDVRDVVVKLSKR